MDYILLVLAAVLITAGFYLNKAYQNSEGTSLAAGFRFAALQGLFTAILFFVLNGFRLRVTGYSMLMALFVNGFTVGYTLLGFRLMKQGTVAAYSLFLMSGGMVVPYFFGLLFLHESFSVLQAIGLLLILAGVTFSNFRQEKLGSRQTVLCCLVFLLNGFVSVSSKLHQTDLGYPAVDIPSFILIGGVIKFILVEPLYLLARRKDKVCLPGKYRWQPVLIIAATAAASGLASLLMLRGASALPAKVLYPFTTGGSIALSSLAGTVLLGEKPTRALTVSIVLCFLGTLLFL